METIFKVGDRVIAHSKSTGTEWNDDEFQSDISVNKIGVIDDIYEGHTTVKFNGNNWDFEPEDLELCTGVNYEIY